MKVLDKIAILVLIGLIIALAIGLIRTTKIVSPTSNAPVVIATTTTLIGIGYTPAQLRILYIDYNEEYFDAKLPCYVEVKYAAMVATQYAQYDTSTRSIELNPTYSSHTKLIRWALLHEMAHLANEIEVRAEKRAGKKSQFGTAVSVAIAPGGDFVQIYVEDPHGGRFEREMRRLMLAGAFKGLW